MTAAKETAIELLEIFAEAEMLNSSGAKITVTESEIGRNYVSHEKSGKFRIGGSGKPTVTYGDGAYLFNLGATDDNSNGYFFTLLEDDMTIPRVLDYISYHQKMRLRRNIAIARRERSQAPAETAAPAKRQYKTRQQKNTEQDKLKDQNDES